MQQQYVLDFLIDDALKITSDRGPRARSALMALRLGLPNLFTLERDKKLALILLRGSWRSRRFVGMHLSQEVREWAQARLEEESRRRQAHHIKIGGGT